jgi:hypothetical protein
VDFYTLSDTFLAKDPIDEFVSAIWTERYSKSGDCKLVLQAIPENVERTTPGTYLALRGSKEVMILETQEIEEGLLTITGNTLDLFLNQRMAWFKNPAYVSTDANSAKIVDYTENEAKPGQFIASAVDKMCINPVALAIPYDAANLSWPDEKITGLSLGAVDTSGALERLTLPIGPLYAGIEQIAEKAGVGFSLYLDSANPVTGYSLKFTTYRGVDHTTGSGQLLVRLVPELDSLQDIKELRSVANFKNVVYVYYKGIISKHLLDPTQPEPEDFDRRVLVTDAEGEPVGHKVTTPRYLGGYGSYTDTVVGPEDIVAFRAQNAKDALANHNYILAVDGQTSPQNDYRFGIEYSLGDIIELQGLTGLISKARVTEYIRFQDKSSEREYPTISVIT